MVVAFQILGQGFKTDNAAYHFMLGIVIAKTYEPKILDGPALNTGRLHPNARAKFLQLLSGSKVFFSKITSDELIASWHDSEEEEEEYSNKENSSEDDSDEEEREKEDSHEEEYYKEAAEEEL